jgi:hypothetical protein
MWGNILTDVMTHPLDRNINKAAEETDKATQALENYFKEVQSGNAEWDETVYNKLVEDINAANAALLEQQQIAQNNVTTYTTVQAALSSWRGALTLTDGEAQNLVGSLQQIEGLENLGEIQIDNGQLKLTDDQIALILEKLGSLQEPSIMQVQLRYDEITSDINELQAFIKDPKLTTITINEIEYDKAEAQARLDELIPEQKEIQLTFGITETSTEEEKSVLEAYQELAKNGVQFTVTVDGAQAKDELALIDETNPDDKTVKLDVDGSTAELAIASIAQQLANIPDEEVIVNIVERRTILESISSAYGGGASALGNAFASGNVGLKSAQSGSVVGELGPEMVVDPIKGIYIERRKHSRYETRLSR